MAITFMSNAKAQKAVKAPKLGYKTTPILTINGLQFKDLNKNGKLDKYEDWRLPNTARALDLVSKMSVEEKVGFMLISSTRMKNDWAFEGPKTKEPITSDFNEEDLVQSTNMFTRQPLPIKMMMAAGTSKAVKDFKLRHFILRANVDARTTAQWSNKLQALCESDALGIPCIIASNPRNHITKDASIGLSVGTTTFSTWPSELGLSAMHDLKLTRTFADVARQEWAAVGLRKGYMYMADLSTEPRWQRIEGTFGEDPEWVGKMIYEIIVGFQGTTLNNQSVALTTKHFPGGGAGEGGQDPHFPWGKREIFTSGNLDNNIIPFKYAIKAGTSSIMPYYSYPVGTKYPEIAYAYNKPVLQGLLRKELGFNGIINSDTGPIEMMPWGAEKLSIEERYIKAIDAGVNIFSGSADPTKLLDIVKAGKVDIHLIDTSVYKLLLEFYQLGLFENPYVDEEAAVKIVNNKSFQEKANLALRKSIVLLRNENKVLPITKKTTKIYLESYMQKKGQAPNNVYKPKGDEAVEFVSTPEAADMIVLWITPGAKSLFESDGGPLSVLLSKNAVDVKYINDLTQKKPTVLVVNYTNPWVINEIYNEQTMPNIKAVIATFGTSTDALIDVITGKFNPTGKMPFTTPSSEKEVTENKTDIPGIKESATYPLFKINEGLSYHK
jgi:beta-glucosidase